MDVVVLVVVVEVVVDVVVELGVEILCNSANKRNIFFMVIYCEIEI